MMNSRIKFSASVGNFGKYRDLVIAIALFLILDLGVLVLNFFASSYYMVMVSERDSAVVAAIARISIPWVLYFLMVLFVYLFQSKFAKTVHLYQISYTKFNLSGDEEVFDGVIDDFPNKVMQSGRAR